MEGHRVEVISKELGSSGRESGTGDSVFYKLRGVPWHGVSAPRVDVPQRVGAGVGIRVRRAGPDGANRVARKESGDPAVVIAGAHIVEAGAVLLHYSILSEEGERVGGVPAAAYHLAVGGDRTTADDSASIVGEIRCGSHLVEVIEVPAVAVGLDCMKQPATGRDDVVPDILAVQANHGRHWQAGGVVPHIVSGHAAHRAGDTVAKRVISERRCRAVLHVREQPAGEVPGIGSLRVGEAVAPGVIRRPGQLAGVIVGKALGTRGEHRRQRQLPFG